MNKQTMVFGMLLLLGLSAARPIMENPYLEERFLKADCFLGYANGLFHVIEDDFDGPSMEGIWIQMMSSYDSLATYGAEGDVASFNAEYAYLMSLINQATFNYFYYGVLYYTQGEGDPEGMYEMYGYYNEELMPRTMSCLIGGID